MRKKVESQKVILVFVGPSGSGKTTVGKELTNRGIPKLITTTTRPPRVGEVNAIDYYFRTPDDMKKEPFVEQTFYNENVYGLTVKEVEEALKKSSAVHVSLDKNGAEAMLKKYPHATKIIYFDVPEEKIIHRMKKRGDSHKKIQERLDFCKKTQEYESPEITHLYVENEDIRETANVILEKFHLNKSVMGK